MGSGFLRQTERAQEREREREKHLCLLSLLHHRHHKNPLKISIHFSHVLLCIVRNDIFLTFFSSFSGEKGSYLYRGGLVNILSSAFCLLLPPLTLSLFRRRMWRCHNRQENCWKSLFSLWTSGCSLCLESDSSRLCCAFLAREKASLKTPSECGKWTVRPSVHLKEVNK